MRNFQRAMRILAVFSAIVSFPAMAADYAPDLVIDYTPQLAPVEVATGWYLRGDIGYTASTSAGSGTYRTFESSTYTSHRSSNELSDKVTLGLGVGYSFTDMIRGDVTLTRISSAFEGTGNCDPSFPANCNRLVSSNLTGYSALANTYVDLGTVVGLTPYVGAGIGYTYLNWDDVNASSLCAGITCAPSTTHAGASDWRFTYALMAGVAYDIAQNMKLDVGYRYTSIDGGDMYGWDTASLAAGATGNQASDGGLSTHEVRVGLRFALW